MRGTDGGRAVVVMVVFTRGSCAPPCLLTSSLPGPSPSIGLMPLLGAWLGLSGTGTVTPELWSPGRGEGEGRLARAAHPTAGSAAAILWLPASARRRLRRRGGGVARFRLPPAVTFLGGGDVRAARRHWAGLAEGGVGSARTSRPFLTAADGRGPEEPGRECGCAVPEAAVGVAVAAVWAQGRIVLGAEF